ncbi:MAG: hypothetical protein FWH29_01145 [Methanobrevibacter sp.]|nr:hypothetical protein [Methanobrevibacter sp.]
MKDSNLTDYLNAKLNMGAKSYSVLSHSSCEKCVSVYKHGNKWFEINDLTYFPLSHHCCSCTIVYSTKTVAENVGKYNSTVGKANFMNSLSETQIRNYDNMLIRNIPKESQDAHKAYSIDSNIFNDYYRMFKKEFKEMYGDITRKEVKILINDLKKSIIILEEDITTFRGFNIMDIDPVKLREVGGLISTSVDEAIAIGYTRGTGKTIELIVLKGTPVMYLRKYSIYPNHMEVLIPPEYYIKEYEKKGKLLYKVVKR